MSRAARQFNHWFLAIVGLPIMGLAAVGLGLNLEPLDGDLTRLGGYSENDFGWRAPIEQFRQVHTEFGSRYDRYFDVLVLGDSFSHGGGHGYWQNYFYQATGLSMQTLHVEKADSIEAIVASPAFRARPPRLVVYEGVEHVLPNRLHLAAEGLIAAGPPPVTGVARRMRPLMTFQHGRLDWTSPIRLDLRVTQNFLGKHLRRVWWGIDETPVRRYRLSRPDLFSSRRSDELLINVNDLSKRVWTPSRLTAFIHQVRDVRGRIEANGKTRFVLMPAADKLTAYAPHIVDSSVRNIDPLAGLERDRTLSMLPLTAALRQAIAEGRQDVYMPNDTHWGPNGHRVAAECLITYLQDTSFFAPVAEAPAPVEE